MHYTTSVWGASGTKMECLACICFCPNCDTKESHWWDLGSILYDLPCLCSLIWVPWKMEHSCLSSIGKECISVWESICIGCSHPGLSDFKKGLPDYSFLLIFQSLSWWLHVWCGRAGDFCRSCAEGENERWVHISVHILSDTNHVVHTVSLRGHRAVAKT